MRPEIIDRRPDALLIVEGRQRHCELAHRWRLHHDVVPLALLVHEHKQVQCGEANRRQDQSATHDEQADRPDRRQKPGAIVSVSTRATVPTR